MTFNSYSQTGITWGITGDVSLTDNNEQPRIVLDKNDNPMVLWGATGNVMFSRWDGTNFIPAVQINPISVTVATASWQGPDIASFGDTVYVVYKETPESANTSPVRIVSSWDGGLNWNSPVQVNNTGDSLTRFPTVTVNETGQPFVAFMKFDPGFQDPRWVVTKSNDYGLTFNADVLASGWSSPTSEVCDCCPGKLTVSGNDVIMLYRDNNGNIRDTWCGVSSDGGASFTSGYNLDQLNWNINACPSSGPDGFILNNTLYSTNMNGSSGNIYSYYNTFDIPTLTPSNSSLISSSVTGINSQNYPRTSNKGNAVGYIWRQDDGTDKACVRFSNEINASFPTGYDTVATNYVINADIAVGSSEVWTVWEDISTNTVKYRMGTYESSSSLINENKSLDLEVYPNPTDEFWTVSFRSDSQKALLQLISLDGKIILYKNIYSDEFYFTEYITSASLSSGTYFLHLNSGQNSTVKKLVKN